MGTLAASGVTQGTFPEADATMLTSMSGSFDVAVDQGEVVGGTWTLDGSSDGVLTTAFGAGDVSNRFQGVGPVGGDADALRLGGAIDTTWTLTLAGTTEVEQDEQRLGPFEVEVLHLTCNTLLGRWAEAFEAQVADAGAWRSFLNGSFTATHVGADPQAWLTEAVGEVTAQADTLLSDAVGGVLEGPGGMVVVDTVLRTRLQDLLERAAAVELALAELDPERGCVLAPSAPAFVTTITDRLQEVAWVLLQDDVLDPAGLELFAEQLLAVGGIGPAVLPSDRPAELESLFATRLSEHLERAVITDAEVAEATGCTGTGPCLPNEPGVLEALRTAQLLQLPVTIAGETYPWQDALTWLVLLEAGVTP